MKKLNGYDNATTTTTIERLPVGGYVLKIKDVDYQTNQWGDTIVLSFDIVEGDQKDYFQKQYDASQYEDKKWKGTYRLRVPADDGSEKDNWTMRRFKTVIHAFEESNPGYHWNWDENTLKDKLIGGIFNNKEYDIDGRTGFYTACHSLVAVDKIRKGDFTIPADTLLKNKKADTATGSTAASDGFMNVPEGKGSEVPFN